MAWTRNGIMPLILKKTPSYLLNNLSANESSLAYVGGSDIAISHTNGELRAIPIEENSKAFQARFVSVQDVELLVIGLNSSVQIWSGTGTRMLFELPLTTVTELLREDMSFVRGVCSIPRGDFLFVGCHTGDILVISVQMVDDDRIEFLESLAGHPAPVTCLASSQIYLASGDDRGGIFVWSLIEGFNRLQTIEGEGHPVTSLAVRENLLVASYSTGLLRMYNISTGLVVAEVTAHSRCINAIDMHPDQLILASVSDDTFLNVWAVPDLDAPGDPEVSLLYSESVGDFTLTGVAFIPDGSNRIAASAYDYDGMHIWNRA
eukprot:CAMPEP_0113941584 /NCGR_PEP_ID=MMETSP1339-20121228/7470_1 /TAXON_ID=94617 /ORGANISM="Fibrocapsa japonica" /LENGTH=318 /DNA_ID=CAMNT_0000945773 /DNA_START=178 /DNA_END=1134 /DNA_ORIENTATION=- /assembly_acc=CAM_ASM_000762